MAKFTDAIGREWKLRITMGDLKDLKEAGLNVSQVSREPAALRDLANDFERFGQVLWVLCETQADELDVSPKQFATAFDGPTLFAAAGAIEEAIWDFSQPPILAKKFSERRGPLLDTMLGELAEKLDRTMTGLSNSAGNWADSSEPIPDHIPF